MHDGVRQDITHAHPHAHLEAGRALLGTGRRAAWLVAAVRRNAVSALCRAVVHTTPPVSSASGSRRRAAALTGAR
ncbi:MULTISPECIES: hypothetical protein [unclassified Streptomyces]|uniref:hypothetical protein n=1 Tax=unclassified Streptomyces TaxID=2593676 RepID=UPI002E1266EE|nr:hypothetical protein OG457_11035 [Streptomyces sp. NBC_01207]WTA17593.1 hypothetical protein OG365_05740 [Streptomyces sp. NBC_00853]